MMDSETFEQIGVDRALIGAAADLLQENENTFVLVAEEKPIGVELPNFVEIKVTHTEPGVKGDTATGAQKPATLETGAVVSVPLFVNQGDVLKIDTRTSSYVERV
jgi:elongation factor P